MKRLWMALWFAVLGWDALQPHFESPATSLAIPCLVLAGLLLARRQTLQWFEPGLSLGLAVVSAVVAFLLPWPESLGALLLVVGFVCLGLPGVRDVAAGNLGRVPLALGGLLLLLAVSGHAYRYVEAWFHDLDFLAAPVAALYRLLGVTAAADPPFVHLTGVGEVHTFDTSTEKFLGFALVQYTLAGLAALLVLNGRTLGWKRPLAFVAAVLGFALVRLLVLGLALDDHPHPSMFYLRTWTFGGMLILVAFLASMLSALAPARRSRAAAVGFGTLFQPPALLARLSCVVLGGAAAAWLGWYDPGVAKSGRILIDEKHSNWEWSTIELNTESYGVQTVYNYSELVRYLDHYWDIEANFELLTDSLLSTTDVLILKTPTRPYGDDEVEAVLRFVERGGGLWLVGDHTNVFGMSTNLNKVARHVGVRYRFDAVVDLLTGGRQFFKRPRWFSHPSIRHMPSILMATSSSMVAPVTARPIMLGRSLLSDELDYSVNSFFGDFAPQAGEPFGAMLQSLSVTHGKGRIIGFSDSTIFSNFFMFIRGKPEMALGSVSWLMHENTRTWPRTLFLVLGVAALVALVVLAARVPRPVVLSGLLLGVLVFAGTARGLDAWVRDWSRLPEPRTPLPIVAFDRGRTDYHIPDLRELPEKSPHSFHTFYVWTQRVGYVPTTRLFERCFDDSEVIVLINPYDHFSREELDRLQRWVSAGGGLLVLDSPHALHSTSRTILEPFGLEFGVAEAESIGVYDVALGDSLAWLYHVKEVKGGEALFRLPDGGAAAAVVTVGEGRVVAMCGSDNFSDAVLGTTSEVPTADQLGLYRLQFRIFDDVLGRGRNRAQRSQGTMPVEPPGDPPDDSSGGSAP